MVKIVGNYGEFYCKNLKKEKTLVLDGAAFLVVMADDCSNSKISNVVSNAVTLKRSLV